METVMQAEQLCLLDAIAASESEEAKAEEPSIVDALLDVHHGDYRRVIEELLMDADFLRDQLYTASCMMSNGMGRGWKPKYERLQ
jgi:hypothetical protein